MNSQHLLVLLLSAPTGLLAAPDSLPGPERNFIWIDGYNAVEWDREYPERSRNVEGLVWGNSRAGPPWAPVTPLLRDSARESPERAAVKALIGAETGDGLFNRFLESIPNRDHQTLVAAGLGLPEIRSSVHGRYHYVDTYSDRFDRLWSSYRKMNGDPMRFAPEGLLLRRTLSWRTRRRQIMFDGNVAQYGGWGAAPRYFTPLYCRGWHLSQTARAHLHRLPMVLSGRIAYDSQQRYYTHQHARSFSLPRLQIRSDFALRSLSRSGVDLAWDAERKPSTSARLFIGHPAEETGGWRMELGAFENRDVFGSLRGSVRLVEWLEADAELRRTVDPALPSYRFVTIGDTISYRCTSRNDFRFHGALSFIENTEPWFAPGAPIHLRLRTWYDHSSHPPREEIDSTNATVEIRQISSPEPVTRAGAGLHIATHPGKLRGELTGGWSHSLGPARERLHRPWRIASTIAWNDSAGRLPWAWIRIEAAAPMTRTWFHTSPSRQAYTMRIDETVGLYFQTGVPFHSPLFPRRLHPRVSVQGGPISLLGPRRVKFHPLGNEFGPLISVACSATW